MYLQRWIKRNTVCMKGLEREHAIDDVRPTSNRTILAWLTPSMLRRPKWVAFRKQRRCDRCFSQNTALRTGQQQTPQPRMGRQSGEHLPNFGDLAASCNRP